MKKVLLIALAVVFFVVLPSPLSAFQQVQRDTLTAADTLQTILEMNEEDLLEQATQDAEDSQLLDRLQRLEEDPMDLNDVSTEELQVIPGVTQAIARTIVETREQLGQFKSLSDLLTIDEIDERLYAVLKRYVRVRPVTPAQFTASSRSRVSRDLKQREGFRDGTYVGSPWKSYNRLLSSYSPYVYGGLLTEKDAGERKLNDFTSGFLLLKTKGPLFKAIAGDYFVEIAQGITVWRSLAFSKGLDVIQPAKKSPRGIAPYISSDESNFYRGGAAVLNLSPLELTAFYSNKKVDASIDTLGNITSVYGVGSHRTQSELRRRFAAQERAAGGRVQISLGKFFRIGSTYYLTKFDRPFLEERLYDLSGQESHVLGADFDFLWEIVNLFGEWARSHTGAYGGIGGAVVNVAKGTEFVVSVRNYPRDFISLHGYGFGERSGATQNEFGIYTGLHLRVASGFFLSGYYDQFKFPWRTATVPFPIQGNDFLFAAELNPFRKFTLELKYKSETKGDAVSTTDEFGRSLNRLADRSQRNGRVTALFDVSRELRVRGRIELVKVEYSEFASGGKGILLYQDIRWRPSSQFTIDARLIFFDTDSYDTRVYEFESDVHGTLFNPALYGKGRRWYLIARYKLLNGLELSAKYSETYRDDLKNLGSGPEEIQGNVDNRFSAQIDIRF